MNDLQDMILSFALAVIPAVLAITLHEAAHGYAAWALGDDTAKRMGRLSLNPLVHVDRVGTILLPGFLLVSQLIAVGHVGFMFGWAKPVPVGAWNFKNPRRGMMLVAAAGPLMNFTLAWLAAVAFHLVPFVPDAALEISAEFLQDFILVNLVLGLFNLLPIPPLDGGRILVGLLPEPLALAWAKVERFGILVVMLLLFVVPQVFHVNPVQTTLMQAVVWAQGWILLLSGNGRFI